ncbi:MAG: IS1 family transposase [Chloroflexi bacterium]|nr:MAG: IS1 family transposase [Chloroflexota bacterium]
MARVAHPSDFCPNEECPDYGKVKAGNIIRFGKTRQGRQRYRCKTCLRTFNENYGTIFHRKHVEEKQIIDSLALIAEGVSISGVARLKGFKADTILKWLHEAAEHVEQVEEALLSRYQINRAQLDAMWSFVARKKEKK